MHIADWIKEERLANDWTLDDLAAKSGVSKGNLSKIENAHVSPTLPILIAIAKGFGLKVGDMLVRSGYTDHQPVKNTGNERAIRKIKAILDDLEM